MAKNKKIKKYAVCNTTDIMNLVEELINISSNKNIDIKNSFRLYVNSLTNNGSNYIYPEFLYIKIPNTSSDNFNGKFIEEKDVNCILKSEVGADLINDSVNDIINRIIEKCNNLNYLFICPYVPDLFDEMWRAWNFISKYKMVDLHIIKLNNEPPSDSNDATEVENNSQK